MKSQSCFDFHFLNCWGQWTFLSVNFLSIFVPSLENSLSRSQDHFLEWVISWLFFELFIYPGYYSSVRCIGGQDSLAFYRLPLHLILVNQSSLMKSHLSIICLFLEQLENYSGSSFLHLHSVEHCLCPLSAVSVFQVQISDLFRGRFCTRW